MAVNQSKYTRKNVERIIDLLGVGFTIAQVCAVIGMSERTFYEWRQMKPEFAAQVEEAREMAIATHIERIKKASKDDWRASAWWLEHVAPDRFARSRVEVKHSGNVSVEHTINQETIDDARNIVAALNIVAGQDDTVLAVPTEQ